MFQTVFIFWPLLVTLIKEWILAVSLKPVKILGAISFLISGMI